MELQWLLICQAFKFNQENGLLDIAGIFSRATISRDRLELSAAVVAKVKAVNISLQLEAQIVVAPGQISQTLNLPMAPKHHTQSS